VLERSIAIAGEHGFLSMVKWYLSEFQEMNSYQPSLVSPCNCSVWMNREETVVNTGNVRELRDAKETLSFCLFRTINELFILRDPSFPGYVVGYVQVLWDWIIIKGIRDYRE
jgi:hypothetical protein